MLTLADVVAYLVEAGLIDRRAVTAGRPRVRAASGRNRVFIVTGEDSLGYVVKQSDPRDRDLLAREAVVLQQVVSAEPRLAGHVPAPLIHDPARGILVCELVGDATDLGSYHARGRFPPALARRVGGTLALLHELGPGAVDAFPAGRDRPLLGLPGNPPTLEQLLDSSDEGVQLLRTLQSSPELCERLAELERSWEAGVLVHGDVRPANCVAFARAGARRRTRIALVDWEAARGGDPHGDLGTVLGEYLHDWLWSITVLDPGDLGRAPQHARHPLRGMQPAIRAFWSAYAAAWPHAPPSLERAVEFAAAHIVEVEFERAQTRSTPDRRADVALQLSLNLLRRPTEAAAHLFGLTVAGAAR